MKLTPEQTKAILDEATPDIIKALREEVVKTRSGKSRTRPGVRSAPRSRSS